MDKEQIIKALECCGDKNRNCSDCTFRNIWSGKCIGELSRNALALIKELTEDAASWKEIAECYQKLFEDGYDDKVRLTEENERLKLDVEVCGAELSRYTENIVQMAKQDRADTVRKMQERLKAHFDTYTDEDEETALYMRNLIDQIAKEMLEDAD